MTTPDLLPIPPHHPPSCEILGNTAVLALKDDWKNSALPPNWSPWAASEQPTAYSNCVLEVDWRLNTSATAANNAIGATP